MDISYKLRIKKLKINKITPKTTAKIKAKTMIFLEFSLASFNLFSPSVLPIKTATAVPIPPKVIKTNCDIALVILMAARALSPLVA